MQMLAGNRFGFLSLNHVIDGETKTILIKAKSIKQISCKDTDDEEQYPWSKSVIFMDYGVSPVVEAIDEILEQLENINPGML